MTDRSSTSARAIQRRWSLALGVFGLILILLFTGTRPIGAAESRAANQCVACHMDAAKLKALTPPDPPASEAGEG